MPFDTHVALKDSNSVASAIFESSTSAGVILRGKIDPITLRVLVDNAGASGGFTELTATGTVNGINRNFTFTQLPTYIVSDGAVYKQLDNNGGVNWSWSVLTATMTIPPTSVIFGWV